MLTRSPTVYANPPVSLSGLAREVGRGFLTGPARRALGVPKSASLLTYRAKAVGLEIATLRLGDVEAARHYYRGVFLFGGHKLVRTGRSLFRQADRPKAWQHGFSRFSWLYDLRKMGRELARAQARSLISDWMDQPYRHNRFLAFGPANRTDVAADRLIALVQCARFLLDNAPEDFANRFFSRVTAEIRFNAVRAVSQTNPLYRLKANIALAYAVIGFAGMENQRDATLERLARELDQQIFADGGHISRNPQVLRDLLADLLPLRTVLEKAHLQVPAGLYRALERMMPALRFFTRMDGGLAVFNGVNDVGSGLTKRILENDFVGGRSLVHARQSGYVRLNGAASSVIVDAGRPVMPWINPTSGNGVFAFEFCDGPARIVTNCGAASLFTDKWVSAARATQGQSGLCVGNRPPGRVLDAPFIRRLFQGPLLVAPRESEVTAETGRQGSVFTGRHFGYLDVAGIVHERRLFLSPDGSDFRGEDRFVPEPDKLDALDAQPFELRFHLHPSVKATLSQDGGSAVLMLADKSGWRFSARGGQLQLEESLFLAAGKRPRKTMQLVLRGLVGRPDKVNWAFKRIEKRSRRVRKKAPCEKAPTLL